MDRRKELDQLRERADRLAEELRQTVDQIEQVKAEGVTPEERRRRFKVITGATVVAPAAWAWQHLRRPGLAVATVAMLGMLLWGPASPEPPVAQPPGPGEPIGPVEPAPEKFGVAPEPAVPGNGAALPEPEPTFEPKPTEPGPTPEPGPTEPVPEPTEPTEPEPTEPEPEPTEPEQDRICLDVELLGIELALCLFRPV